MPRPKIDLSGPLDFEQLGKCFFQLGEFRAPKAGEFYLSGAEPRAYRAPNDLTMDFWIVKPTHRAVQVARYARGEAL